jgi:hypothetical protein
VKALAAAGPPQEQDMIAHHEIGNPVANLFDDTGAFVAENDRQGSR